MEGTGFPPVGIPAAKGIGMLSLEQFGGGFAVFASKRASPTVAQLWSTNESETDWIPWGCFDSLPGPDRLAAHALRAGTEEVFATTRCGGLYRREEEIQANSGLVWLPWQPFGLPRIGSLVTDVALSRAADDANIVYVSDGGRVFARPRLGSEQSSPYADWSEIAGLSNAALVTAGLRSDRRQQVFVVDTDGSVRTAIQSTSGSDSPFGPWSDFDSSQLPGPVIDIEAPLGGPFPLEVFAVGSNGALWQRTQDKTSGAFGPWRAWDGPAPPAKLVSVTGAGLKYKSNTPLRLSVLTQAGSVYTSRRTLSVWEDWRLFP